MEEDQNYVSFSIKEILDDVADKNVKKYIKTDYDNQLKGITKRKDNK